MAISTFIKQWAPRIGIVGSVIAVVSGGIGLYSMWTDGPPDCGAVGAIWRIELVVEKSTLQRAEGDTYIFEAVLTATEPGKWQLLGEQEEYNTNRAVMHRALQGEALCTGEYIDITFIQKASEGISESTRDVPFKAQVKAMENQPGKFAGTFTSTFNDQEGTILISTRH